MSISSWTGRSQPIRRVVCCGPVAPKFQLFGSNFEVIFVRNFCHVSRHALMPSRLWTTMISSAYSVSVWTARQSPPGSSPRACSRPRTPMLVAIPLRFVAVAISARLGPGRRLVVPPTGGACRSTPSSSNRHFRIMPPQPRHPGRVALPRSKDITEAALSARRRRRVQCHAVSPHGPGGISEVHFSHPQRLPIGGCARIAVLLSKRVPRGVCPG